MNILIVKTSAIGDVTHTLPALDALHRHYPNASIDWLVEEAAANLIIDHPQINQVLISKRKSWIQLWKQGFRIHALREFYTFIKHIRKTRYDLLIDFQGLIKSSIFIACARSKRKVGFGRGMEHAELSYLFLNEKVPAVDMDLHAVEREKILLSAIGVHKKGNYHLPIKNSAKNRVIELLTCKWGVGEKRALVVINPMTTWPTKHWQNDAWAKLVDFLIAAGVFVVFSGGSDDGKKIENILALTKEKNVPNLAGKTSLQELAALFTIATVVVSTDTGPMHIAALSGSPVVALFGPTAPWRTGPYGNQHIVIQKDLPCIPCLKKECRLRTNDCMKKIQPEEVFNKVITIVQATDNDKIADKRECE